MKATESGDMLKKRYRDAREQLEKGRRLFESVLTPMTDLSGHNWKHLGFVCFPEVQSREELSETLNLNQEELKVLFQNLVTMKYNIFFRRFLQRQNLRIRSTSGGNISL